MANALPLARRACCTNRFAVVVRTDWSMDEARESFETVLKLVPLSELGREVKQVLEDMGRVD